MEPVDACDMAVIPLLCCKFRSVSASRQSQPDLADRLDVSGGVAEVLQTLVALPVEERLDVTPHAPLPSLDEALGLAFGATAGMVVSADHRARVLMIISIRFAGHQRALAMSLRWDGLVNCSNLLFQ